MAFFLQLAIGLSWLYYGVDSTDPDDDPLRGWQRFIDWDLKPDNVFPSKRMSQENPYPFLVLGDFGLAMFERVTMATGDPKYRAPEGRIEVKSDVWALGITIYELFHEQPLGTTKLQPIPKEYSGKLNRIMMDCLLTRPEERVSSRSLAVYLKEKSPSLR